MNHFHMNFTIISYSKTRNLALENEKLIISSIYYTINPNICICISHTRGDTAHARGSVTLCGVCRCAYVVRDARCLDPAVLRLPYHSGNGGSFIRAKICW